MQQFGELQHRFEVRGGYELDHRSSEILAGLGLSGLDQDRPVTSLSGGELSRVALAALLLEAPDVLLLDEPTNHLDMSGLNWLQTYLSGYRGGILFVSHDRVFIDAVATSIVELDENLHTLERYEGNYQRYLEAKAAKRARQQQAYETWQEEIAELEEQARTVARSIGHGRAASDNDKRSYNNRGIGVDKAISRNVRAAQERLERLKRTPVEPPPEPMRFSAVIDRAARANDSEALVASNLSKSFGDRQLFSGLDFALKDGDRLAVVGPNGAGKSTLIEMLLGKFQPDTGSVYVGKGRRVGFLEQHPRQFPAELNLGQAFIWALHQEGLTHVSNEARGWLVRWGLFRRSDLPKPVNSLSTGQIRKLEIALIFASEPDILILDEPTNHVSLSVLESFETALAEFTGPVLAVSHDRRFLKRFGGHTISLGVPAHV
jgi:macrolide transport system ATP-binding/permease protein